MDPKIQLYAAALGNLIITAGATAWCQKSIKTLETGTMEKLTALKDAQDKMGEFLQQVDKVLGAHDRAIRGEMALPPRPPRPPTGETGATPQATPLDDHRSRKGYPPEQRAEPSRRERSKRSRQSKKGQKSSRTRKPEPVESSDSTEPTEPEPSPDRRKSKKKSAGRHEPAGSKRGRHEPAGSKRGRHEPARSKPEPSSDKRKPPSETKPSQPAGSESEDYEELLNKIESSAPEVQSTPNTESAPSQTRRDDFGNEESSFDLTFDSDSSEEIHQKKQNPVPKKSRTRVKKQVGKQKRK